MSAEPSLITSEHGHVDTDVVYWMHSRGFSVQWSIPCVEKDRPRPLEETTLVDCLAEQWLWLWRDGGCEVLILVLVQRAVRVSTRVEPDPADVHGATRGTNQNL